jgi:F-type H+-transporting ATPase subunit delta
MSINRIASRYAKSLMELAIDQNVLPQVNEDMLSLLKLCKESSDFASFLRSPVIRYDKKKKVFDLLLAKSFQSLTSQFINLLASKQREHYLQEVAEEFVLQYRFHNQISQVRVISAAPLTPELLKGIQEKLEQSSIGFSNVEVITKIDPNLIGGFVIEYEGNVYDASIKHQLELMKKQFQTNLYETQVGR